MKIKSICNQCKKEYTHWDSQNLKFCCFECYNKNRIGKIKPKSYDDIRHCTNCNKLVRVDKRRIRENKRFFCGVECKNEFVRGINSNFYGRHHTNQNKEVLRKYAYEQFKNPEKITRHKLACKNSRHIWTKEEKKKFGEMKRRFYLEHPEKHPNRVLGGHNISKPQLELYLLIKERYPEARLEFPIRTLHSIRFADIGIPSMKLDIEYDSDYWHNKVLDEIRTKHLEEVGWKVLRFSNKDNIQLKVKELF